MDTKTQLEKMNSTVAQVLPKHLDLFYGGEWHRPAGGYAPTLNPSNQQVLAEAAEANTADIDAAVKAAQQVRKLSSMASQFCFNLRPQMSSTTLRRARVQRMIVISTN